MVNRVIARVIYAALMIVVVAAAFVCGQLTR
jgi:hypothetical protein